MSPNNDLCSFGSADMAKFPSQHSRSCTGWHKSDNELWIALTKGSPRSLNGCWFFIYTFFSEFFFAPFLEITFVNSSLQELSTFCDWLAGPKRLSPCVICLQENLKEIWFFLFWNTISLHGNIIIIIKAMNVKTIKEGKDICFDVNIFQEVFQSNPTNAKKSLPSSTVLVQYDLLDCQNQSFRWIKRICWQKTDKFPKRKAIAL